MTYDTEFDRVHYPFPLLPIDSNKIDSLRKTAVRDEYNGQNFGKFTAEIWNEN